MPWWLKSVELIKISAEWKREKEKITSMHPHAPSWRRFNEELPQDVILYMSDLIAEMKYPSRITLLWANKQHWSIHLFIATLNLFEIPQLQNTTKFSTSDSYPTWEVKFNQGCVGGFKQVPGGYLYGFCFVKPVKQNNTIFICIQCKVTKKSYIFRKYLLILCINI